MGKNRLSRLLGLLLAMVLMAVTVISPVSAAEAGAFGSESEEEYIGSADDSDAVVYEETDAFDGVDVAESIADDFYEYEGEEVTDDAALVLPEDVNESDHPSRRRPGYRGRAAFQVHGTPDADLCRAGSGRQHGPAD